MSGEADARERLEQLEEEERAVSARRGRLHDRMDFLRTSGGPDAEERLARLEEEERELSARRLALHTAIDELRAGSGLGDRGAAPKGSLRDR